MTIRVSSTQLSSQLIDDIILNRRRVDRFSREISTGIKAETPGDSPDGGQIVRQRQLLERVDGYTSALEQVRSALNFQDGVLTPANELLVRAKEIATQFANETNDPTTRALAATEVFELRDAMVNLANSTFQGKYIYNGAADNVPPYTATTYGTPTTGAAHDRYVYGTNAGAGVARVVRISDSTTIQVNTVGNQTGPTFALWDNPIQALERLGRALAGYDTLPAVGAPDGTGGAFSFPQNTALQTADILGAIDLLETARTTGIQSERTSIAGRLNRLEVAENVLARVKEGAQSILSALQDSDLTESASNLQLAQTALESSYAVTSRVLNLSILNFI